MNKYQTRKSRSRSETSGFLKKQICCPNILNKLGYFSNALAVIADNE
jgi:hypothetical protein